MRRSMRAVCSAVLATLALISGWLFVTSGALAANAAGSHLFVSITGKTGQADTSCATAAFSTIGDAVSAAVGGDVITVCAGTYTESVTLTQPLTLKGQGATIDATGQPWGVAIMASNTTVKGFTVENALGMGIAALPLNAFSNCLGSPCAPLTGVTVQGNVVINNNKGYSPPQGCTAPGLYPGDCGGGILFDAVAFSKIVNNTVQHNVDGVLVVDDFGPTHDNVISANTVTDNVNECGITLPSHNPGAVSVMPLANGSFKITGRNPSAGGVYNNLVEGNIVDRNGTAGFKANLAGSGAGVLLASGGPGTGVYDNTVINNRAYGNGLAGITIHAHYTGGEDLRGNKLLNNIIGRNNVSGDQLDTPITAADFSTTGIMLFSAMPIQVVVKGNVITNDTFGIWATPNIDLDASGNVYLGVATPVFYSDTPYGTALKTLSVSSTSATLLGAAVANGAPTTAFFEWNTAPSPPFYTATAPQKIGSGTGIVPVIATITGLTPGTTYYYLLVVTNRNGTTTGITQSFTTPAAT
jgi:hypothetical protein